MTTMRTKTVWYPFETLTTNLATNTTLGTATRHDFAAVTLHIPETGSRNFLSVRAVVSYRDVFTSAGTEVTGWRLGIKLGAVAFDDLDRTFTQPDTGNALWDEIDRDVTDYFNTNFGAGASQTCQIGIAVSSDVASNIGGGIVAGLVITFEYDDEVGTERVKTIPIPIQSLQTQLTTSQQEVGCDGTESPAPANQIPALDTYLEEDGKTYRATWIDMDMRVANSGTTDVTPLLQIDAVAEVTGPTWEGALAAPTWMLWRYLYPTGTHATNAAHAFKMRADAASRIPHVAAVLWVTYTYDKSTSTRTTNWIEVGVNGPRGEDPPSANYSVSPTGATPGDGVLGYADFVIPEPGTITMKQSGIYAVLNVRSSGPGVHVACGHQQTRQYTPNNSISWTPLFHRADHTGGWLIKRGRNRLNVFWYNQTERRSAIFGRAWVVYSSDVPAGGTEAASRVVDFFIKSFSSTIAATFVVDEDDGARTPNLQGQWYLNSVIAEYRSRGQESQNLAHSLWVGSNVGEHGDGFFVPQLPGSLTSPSGVGELTTGEWDVDLTSRFTRFAGAPVSTRMIDEPRRWAYQTGNASHHFGGSLRISFHEVRYSAAASVVINGSPAANGKTVDIYAENNLRSCPRVRSVGTAAVGAGAATPTMPHHIAGTVAVLLVNTRGDEAQPTLSVDAGFTFLATYADTTADTTGVRLTIFTKRCESSVEGNPTVADGGEYQNAVIVCIDGCRTDDDPWDVFDGNDTTVSGTDTAVSIPGLNTTVDEALVLTVVASGNDRTSSGWTNAGLGAGPLELFDGIGSGSSIAFASGVKQTAGAVAATTATLSATARQARFAIAFRGPEPERETELVASVLTSGGTGAFSASTTDDTRGYYASYNNDGNYGRSALATPS